MEAFVAYGVVDRVLAKGDTKSSIVTDGTAYRSTSA